MTIQDRFDILRGYYDNSGFHPAGTSALSLNEMLLQMEFRSYQDFLLWYKSLKKKDVIEGKEEWCSGDCCQSLLIRLLELEKSNR